MKNFIKQISTATLALAIVLVGFAYVEPNVASAVDDEVIVNLTVTSGISITSPADVTMSAMSVTDNVSTGWAVWNVKTNDTDGYTLEVSASADPAMVSGGDSFTDYTEAVADTPETWSVASGQYEFGFSALGSHVENYDTDAYGATGETVCDNGVASSTLNSNLNWQGFETVDTTIAESSAPTTPDGTDTRICFAAEQNGVYAPSGTYSATITATATTL